ncbi:hypothetical protein GN956_G21633 [Arapaima gigas]
MEIKVFPLLSFISLVLLEGIHEIEGLLESPDISVTQSSVSEGQSVAVTCEAPAGRGIQCSLYRNTEETPFKTEGSSGSQCDFTVSAEELLQGQTLTGNQTAVNLSCVYSTGGSSSTRSNRAEVKVLGDLTAPQLTVNPTEATESDSVQLSCESLSGSVSKCWFLSDGQRVTESPSACQSSFTGAQLLRRRNHTADAQVRLECQYVEVIAGHLSPSQPSNSVTVTLWGLTVNPTLFPVSRPVGISVSAAGVTEAGSVTVTCVAPPTVGGTTWRLYRDTQDSPFMTKTEEQNRVQFTREQVDTHTPSAWEGGHIRKPQDANANTDTRWHRHGGASRAERGREPER